MVRRSEPQKKIDDRAFPVRVKFRVPPDGLWRVSDRIREWLTREIGSGAYAMVMTEACQHVADVHDRMPVILRREDWGDWLNGSPDAAGLLCRRYPEQMTVERTRESWVRR